MRSKKIYITLGVLVALSVAFFALIIVPIFNSIQKDAKNYLTYKQDYSLAGLKIKNLENFNELYEGYRAELNRIDSLFIDKEVPVEFIRFLENTAQEFKLEIKVSSVTVEADKDNSGNFLNFQISIYGSFSNFYKFLSRMENSPYLIEVGNLSMKKLTSNLALDKGAEGLSQNDISANFTLRVAAK